MITQRRVNRTPRGNRINANRTKRASCSRPSRKGINNKAVDIRQSIVLQRIIKESGMTRREIAEKSECSVNTITQSLNGRYSLSPKLYRKILQAINYEHPQNKQLTLWPTRTSK